MDDLRRQVIWELALKYKSSNDSTIFQLILKRLDKLLLCTIKALRRYRRHLRSINTHDLYHCCVLGVYSALLDFQKGMSSEDLEKLIFRHVQSQIQLYYPHRTRELLLADLPERLVEDVKVFEEHDSRVLSFFRRMIEEKVITRQDFIIIVRKALDGVTYVNLGKELGMGTSVARRRVLKILEKIREYNEELMEKNDEGYLRPRWERPLDDD